jgi:hypothetical protein
MTIELPESGPSLLAAPGPIAVVALVSFGGEGEIRTHETREGLPVFKSDDSHANGAHSHAIARIVDCSRNTQTLQSSALRIECNLSATCTPGPAACTGSTYPPDRNVNHPTAGD